MWIFFYAALKKIQLKPMNHKSFKFIWFANYQISECKYLAILFNFKFIVRLLKIISS